MDTEQIKSAIDKIDLSRFPLNIRLFVTNVASAIVRDGKRHKSIKEVVKVFVSFRDMLDSRDPTKKVSPQQQLRYSDLESECKLLKGIRRTLKGLLGHELDEALFVSGRAMNNPHRPDEVRELPYDTNIDGPLAWSEWYWSKDPREPGSAWKPLKKDVIAGKWRQPDSV